MRIPAILLVVMLAAACGGDDNLARAPAVSTKSGTAIPTATLSRKAPPTATPKPSVPTVTPTPISLVNVPQLAGLDSKPKQGVPSLVLNMPEPSAAFRPNQRLPLTTTRHAPSCTTSMPCRPRISVQA